MSTRNDLDGQQISINQPVEGCYQSESDPATYFLGYQEDASKYDRKAVQERCRSGAGRLDVLGCRPTLTVVYVQIWHCMCSMLHVYLNVCFISTTACS